MNQHINCNFARTAIHFFTIKHLSKRNHLPSGSIVQILRDYNSHFKDAPQLKVPYSIASKKFTSISRNFSNRWHPGREVKQEFMVTFSTSKWEQLSQEEKSSHTLSDCQTCQTKYDRLSQCFPGTKKRQRQKNHTPPSISFIAEDLTTPKRFGKKILREANSITTQVFEKSITDVIEETPRSKLTKKLSHTQRQTSRRKFLREVKNTIQNEMESEGDSVVLQNRLSWSSFDKLRKKQGLAPAQTGHSHPSNDSQVPPRKRKKHGVIPSHVNTDDLLEEARTWTNKENINWTNLGTRYGLTGGNRGQVIKDFLAEQEIPAACTKQRLNRAPRRSKKRLPGGQVSFPMYRPVSVQKQKMKEKISKGEIQVGSKVVPTSYSSYTTDPKTQSIVERTTQVSARKISLTDIRKKLLSKHERLGVIRNYPDEYFDSLSEDAVKTWLQELHQPFDSHSTPEQLLEILKTISRTRHLKVCHDHSDISGHSHMLLLVAAVYDPAFYYTTDEMKIKGINLNVQTVVEEPEIHILGRSSSSLQDQSMFSQCRRECLSDITTTIYSTTRILLDDVIRFFHGDGPAQQFEAGNKIGGHYCCVGCDALASRFDDLTYCFRAQHLTLKERQAFVLQGEVWNHNTINPFNNLKIAALRSELSKRGVNVVGKKKPELQKI